MSYHRRLHEGGRPGIVPTNLNGYSYWVFESLVDDQMRTRHCKRASSLVLRAVEVQPYVHRFARIFPSSDGVFGVVFPRRVGFAGSTFTSSKVKILATSHIGCRAHPSWRSFLN